MPKEHGRPPRNFRPLYVALSDKTAKAVEDLALARGTTRSDVIDRAINDYLDERRDGRWGILIPPNLEPRRNRRYNIEPATDDRLTVAWEKYGLTIQNVVRAAVYALTETP